MPQGYTEMKFKDSLGHYHVLESFVQELDGRAQDALLSLRIVLFNSDKCLV